jgi:hypothetical protein
MQLGEFLALASVLLAQLEDKQNLAQHPEALGRTVVGRAYYACLSLGKSMLTTHYGSWPQGGKGHKLVEDLLKLCEDEDLVELGYYFSTLRTARRVADYRLDDTEADTASNSKTHFELACNFCDKLNTMSNDPGFGSRHLNQQLHKAVNDYKTVRRLK